MITQHGPLCDVCGDYILLDTSINPFDVKGIDRVLHCHDECRETILEAGSDWQQLPTGPLRSAFEKAAEK